MSTWKKKRCISILLKLNAIIFLLNLEEPGRVASPTRINLEEPGRVASPTRINLEEPGRVASPTRINLEGPGRVASPTRINLEESISSGYSAHLGLICLPGGTHQGGQPNQDKPGEICQGSQPNCQTYQVSLGNGNPLPLAPKGFPAKKCFP